MKKDSLLKMKDLPATEEMLAVAREDVPVKVGSGWNTSYRCRYSGFARSSVEGGILKVTLYDPDAMRLGGTLPVYEIFMEKEKQQFLTYDRAHDKWRTAKIDYLEWQAKGSNNVWISAVDDAQIRQYLVSDEKSVYRAILKFQRAVRDAELERRHRKETDPWDAELSQTPPLPKDWERWVNKVGIQENYIFYDYCKGGARYGYCTYCEKEVALKQRPYHNAVGKCPRCRHMDAGIRHLRKYAQENDIPIDGIVVTYNDAAYARSCGRTGHHYKDGLAFKFEDDTYETVLRSIEWTPSRTGEIAPAAIFDTVEIDGCAVSRASLHNLSFIENLELAPGCRIKVSKRNQIIPHVEENLDRNCYSRDKVVPARCPCCGQPTRIHMTKNTVNGVEKVTAALFCDNEHCETRKLRKFVHFASPKAMNIMGLSESILEKFIGKGWLHSYMDIFALDKHRAEIVQMEGFGEKSWQNLWDAIQHSRITTFEQYLTAMDIPMVGSTASKAICQRFRGNLAEFETAVCQSFDFTQLPDFGETLHRNIHQWFRSEENWTIWTELRRLVCIKTYQPPAASTDMSNPFVGKTLVVTGKVEPYTRDGINEKIESLGAHAGSSVSSKTDYLICGENAGSKLAKAQELGIKILSPDEFFRMAGESA